MHQARNYRAPWRCLPGRSARAGSFAERNCIAAVAWLRPAQRKSGVPRRPTATRPAHPQKWHVVVGVGWTKRHRNEAREQSALFDRHHCVSSGSPSETGHCDFTGGLSHVGRSYLSAVCRTAVIRGRRGALLFAPASANVQSSPGWNFEAHTCRKACPLCPAKRP